MLRLRKCFKSRKSPDLAFEEWLVIRISDCATAALNFTYKGRILEIYPSVLDREIETRQFVCYRCLKTKKQSIGGLPCLVLTPRHKLRVQGVRAIAE